MRQGPTPVERARIALFIRSLKGNGAERSMGNLAAALAARGHEVDLVLANASGPFLKDVPPEVRVVDLKVRTALGALSLAVRRPSDFAVLLPVLASPRAPRALGAIPALARYLRARRPQALLSALDMGNVAAVIARDLAGVDVRVALSQRNHFTSDLLNARDPTVARLAPIVRRFYPRADRIVAVSDGVAEDLAERCGLPRTAVATIYNPVVGPSLARLAAEPVDEPWYGDGAGPVLLAVGKLKPQKDFPTLLRAFAALRATRPARLVILGEGPDRAALETLARELGVGGEVRMPGFDDNPFAHMARADLFVLSSAFEGLPGVLIQALACGCPAVSTDCPSGPREILEGGRHGALVPVGDATALASAIARALDTPPDRAALRARAGFFSFERSAEAYERVLLASPDRPRG
ncbi:glycosyltransferase [Methylopila sp. 73B]|uniref:glycosyltransferase n=1 Tax=Methylopila sp. 73B TaxID=1120792 RepID=UPI00037E1C13|nr:glycosyltransferase [Methylopila sp. 73B]